MSVFGLRRREFHQKGFIFVRFCVLREVWCACVCGGGGFCVWGLGGVHQIDGCGQIPLLIPICCGHYMGATR